MVEARLLDSAGRRRSPASMPGYHLGRIPRNKGQRYPGDPPRTAEIVAVTRHAEVPARIGGHLVLGGGGARRDAVTPVTRFGSRVQRLVRLEARQT